MKITGTFGSFCPDSLAPHDISAPDLRVYRWEYYTDLCSVQRTFQHDNLPTSLAISSYSAYVQQNSRQLTPLSILRA